jgi:hypothetical protein
MVVLKLGYLCSKRKPFQLLLKKSRKKYSENILLFLICIFIDFVLMLWANFQSDLLFFVISFIFSVIITVVGNRNVNKSIFEAAQIWLFDLCILFTILYNVYLIPLQYQSLLKSYSDKAIAFSVLTYVYPLNEWVLEILID